MVCGSCSSVSNTISLISSKWDVARMSIPSLTYDLYNVQHDKKLESHGNIIYNLIEMRYANTYFNIDTMFSNEEIVLMLESLCTD